MLTERDHLKSLLGNMFCSLSCRYVQCVEGSRMDRCCLIEWHGRVKATRHLEISRFGCCYYQAFVDSSSRMQSEFWAVCQSVHCTVWRFSPYLLHCRPRGCPGWMKFCSLWNNCQLKLWVVNSRLAIRLQPHRSCHFSTMLSSTLVL